MMLLIGTGVLFAAVIAIASALLILRRRGRVQNVAPHRTSRRQHRSALVAAFVAPGALLTTWSFTGFSAETQYGWVLGWIPGLLAAATAGGLAFLLVQGVSRSVRTPVSYALVLCANAAYLALLVHYWLAID
jgi:hypothetical protein